MNEEKLETGSTKEESTIRVPKKLFKYVAYGLILLLLLLGACAIGVRIGTYRGRFGRPFIRPEVGLFQKPGSSQPDLPGPFTMRGPMPMMRNWFGEKFKPGRGIVGSITKIEDSSVTVKDDDGNKKVLLVSNKTIIKSDSKELQLKDLKVDDKVIAFGNIDKNGNIEAVLIRILPEGSSLLLKDYLGCPMRSWFCPGD